MSTESKNLSTGPVEYISVGRLEYMNDSDTLGRNRRRRARLGIKTVQEMRQKPLDIRKSSASPADYLLD